MNQPTLWDRPPVSRSTDPKTSHLAEQHLNRARRGSQKQNILDRLRGGPATNVELAGICLKYTGRISDLRKDGYDVVCEVRADGVSVYRLGGE